MDKIKEKVKNECPNDFEKKKNEIDKKVAAFFDLNST